PSGDVRREVAGVDVGHGGDERGPQKRPDARDAASLAPKRATGGARDRGLAGEDGLERAVTVAPLELGPRAVVDDPGGTCFVGAARRREPLGRLAFRVVSLWHASLEV